MALPADRKHKIGFALMPLGLLSAGVAVLVLVPVWPLAGLLAFLASVFLVGIGTWMKRRYCPRCRESACTVPRKTHQP